MESLQKSLLLKFNKAKRRLILLIIPIKQTSKPLKNNILRVKKPFINSKKGNN